jgi:hypothetical protein
MHTFCHVYIQTCCGLQGDPINPLIEEIQKPLTVDTAGPSSSTSPQSRKQEEPERFSVLVLICSWESHSKSQSLQMWKTGCLAMVPACTDQ